MDNIDCLSADMYKLYMELEDYRLQRMCAKARTGELMRLQYFIEQELMVR